MRERNVKTPDTFQADSCRLSNLAGKPGIKGPHGDRKRTFGYYRFKILAAAFNALLLFAVAIYILYEAYQRLRIPAEIQSMGMLVIAVAGLCINLIRLRLLRAGSDSHTTIQVEAEGFHAQQDSAIEEH